MSKRILVTGSSGTVGTALCIRLRELGYQIIPLDIKATIWDKEIDKKTVRFDLRKTVSPKLFPKKPDLIVHLAANARVHELVLHPKKSLDNYLMTYNVLAYAQAAGVKRVLFSSSREVYGETPAGKASREGAVSPPLVRSPYTASKLGCEGLLHAYHHCYGIKPVIVRLSNVYGRYDVSERVIPVYLHNALRNRDIVIFGKEKKLDFTWIDDAVDGLVSIIRHFDSVAGLSFNISSGKGEKIQDIAKQIIELTNSDSRIKIGKKRTGEISHFTGDIKLAKKKLGYNPNVKLSDGLVKTVEWYLSAMKDRRIANTQKRILRSQGIL